MTLDALITVFILAGTLVVLGRGRLPPALTLLGAVVILLLIGVITPAQAFSGFSNRAPVIVAALFVLAAAVERTGAIQPLVAGVLGGAVGRHSALTRLLVPTAGVSAFMNNTPIVAILAPQVAAWAERNGTSPSRFLMPLSFATLLGGVVTLIGTSTNVVVSGLLEAAGHPPLRMFELTPVGLPVALVGLGVLILTAPRLLPDRRAPRQQAEEELREFVVCMRVKAGGPLDGRTVEEAGLRHLHGVFLYEIERNREMIAPVAPATVLAADDLLTFVGRADDVVDLQHTRGLVSSEQNHMLLFDSPGHTFFEAVIGESSPLVGKTLREADFRGRYQAAVVAIHRAGQRIQSKLGEVPLRVGDTLLLLADPAFRERWRDRGDFLLVARLGGAPPIRSAKAALVGVILLGVVGAAATGLMPVLHASLLGAMATLVFGVLTPGEARRAIDLDVLIVIAAAFGLSAAIETTGLAAAFGNLIVLKIGAYGPVAAVTAIVIATMALTELITNNAAAALIFPIALAVGESVGLDPRAVAVAIAIAASASFLTPIGYQTNTMVYGPGGYRFTDYFRLGFPLSLVVIVITVVLTV